MAPETVVMDKNVEFTTDVVDELGSSVVNVDIELSTIAAGESGYYTFKPSMGLEYVLQDESIEVPSLDAFDFSKFTTEVVKNETIDESSRGGANVVVVVYYDNTQVGTLTYRWSFEKKIIEEVGQVYPAPHLEVSRYAVMEQVIVSENGEGYLVETPVNVTIQKVGANSSAETTVTLRPRYNLVIAAPEPEPEYTFEVVWGEWVEGDYTTKAGAYLPVTVYAHKSVGGEVVKTDETFFHLYTPALRDDFTFRGINATSGNTGNLEVTPYDEDSFERGGFFHTTHVTRFSYMWVFETFRFQTSLVELVYTDGDYNATLEVGLDTTWKKEEDVFVDSSASNPDYEGGRYIGTDIFTFSSEKVVRTDANYTEKDASGENVMVFTFSIDKLIYE